MSSRSVVSTVADSGRQLFGRVPGSRKAKIVILSSLAGVALLTAIYSFLNRRRRSKADNGRTAGNYAAPASPRTASQRASVARRFLRTESTRNRRTNSPGFSGAHQVELVPFRPSSVGPETLLHIGLDSLTDAIRSWEKAVVCYGVDGKLNVSPSEQELLASLEEILSRCQQLRGDISELLQRHICDLNGGVDSTDAGSMVSASSTLRPGSYMGGLADVATGGGYRGDFGGSPSVLSADRRGTLSVLSDDSFVSALEDMIPIFDDMDILVREPLDIDASLLYFYQEGLRAANEGRVQFRKLRMDTTKCSSEEDFAAKVYCIRKALNLILSDDQKRIWMVQTGRQLIAELLRHAKKDPTDFYAAFDHMSNFLSNTERHAEIEDELKYRNVAQFSFYDVVLDFILLDSFDDLSRPPSAVLAVARNRFLSDSFKESTLSTVIWSMLKAKRSRMLVSDGFIAHFYDISEQISPTITWGFLGTDDHLRELCYYFREQSCNFVIDIFNGSRVRYTSLRDLAEDVWHICRTRLEMVQQRFSSELLPPE